MQVQNEIDNDSIWRFIIGNRDVITFLAGCAAVLFSAALKLSECFRFFGIYDYHGINKDMMLISVDWVSEYLMFLALLLCYIFYITISVIVMNKKKNFIICIGLLFIFPIILLCIGHIYYTFVEAAVIIIFHVIITFLWGYFLDEPWYNIFIRNDKANDESEEGKIFTKILCFIAMMMVLFTYLICSSYDEGYNYAKSRNEYGIVNLNDENFAVIYSNTEKSVLQKCYINESDNTVVIQKNTYAIIDNNGHIINNRRFDSVKIEA